MSDRPHNDPTQIPPRWLAALCGVAAAATSIAVATFVASLGRLMRSPIVDVGDRFIEFTPGWLKDLAISLFGTNDKLALLVGIGLFLLGFAVGAGIVAMRKRLAWGVAAVAVFGVVGSAAAVGSGRGPVTMLPSLTGAIAGISLLWWFHRRWYETVDTVDAGHSGSRRRLLIGLGGAAIGVGVLGATGLAFDRRFGVRSTIAAGSLPAVADPLPPFPAAASLDVSGVSPLVTPNSDFYRIDTALTPPQISPEEFELRIFGMVDRELNLSYEDLLRQAQIETDITLTCVSNEVGGSLTGNARWQGVRLENLLAEAGVSPGADQVVGRSYDNYTCGFPVSAATDGRDALVAVGMNGEPLPLEHGYPARLIVPGLYGYVSATKWLQEIEITTFDAFDHYWARRGWAVEAPIKTSSRIDTPGAFEQVPVGEAVIAGVAWAQTRGIERVEVQVDGRPWEEAELAAEINDTTWRQWRLPWVVTPGRHDITVRAVDGHGRLQVGERSRPMPDGATGWHSVVAMGMET